MKLFMFMGASGSGKTAIQHSLPIEFMTNCTTRHLRPGEINGYHINQVSETDFLKLQEDGYFLETTYYAGNYYGTPINKITEMLNGKPFHCTKDINGVIELKKELGKRAVSIYIKPPSVDELVKRMKKRGDSELEISKRINYLISENETKNEQYADYVIENKDLKSAQLEAHKIVIKEILN